MNQIDQWLNANRKSFVLSHDESRELKVDRRICRNVSATATFLSYPYVLNFLLSLNSCSALPQQRRASCP